MSFIAGLLAARSHFAFLLGLGGALLVMRTVDHRLARRSSRGLAAAGPLQGAASPPAAPPAALELSGAPSPRPRGPLTPLQLQVAKDAWAFFVRNTRPSGLVDSADAYPSTTLWDQGSALMGILAARELGLIEEKELVARAGRLLDALLRMPLVAGLLPNRAYDTRTLTPADLNGKPLPEKTGGWSALDLGRISAPLAALAWRSPALAARVRALLARWHLDEATRDGELWGGDLRSGEVVKLQEGRLGYEQYAATALNLFSLDVSRAADLHRHLRVVRVSGQTVPEDDRDPAKTGGVKAPVLSEPWLLLGLEHGFTVESLPLAQAVFLAQEARFRETGTLTAVTEENLDRAPFFAYATVFEGGKPWRVFDPAGQDVPAARTLSTKAALGWAALFAGPYADRLEAAGEAARVAGKGLHSGRYEQDGAWNSVMTANTCGVSLEALAYRVRGPLLRAGRQP